MLNKSAKSSKENKNDKQTNCDDEECRSFSTGVFTYQSHKWFSCQSKSEMNEAKTIPVYDFQKFRTFFESEDFELFLGDFGEFNIADISRKI